MDKKINFNCRLFDGEKVYESVKVEIDNETITKIMITNKSTEKTNYMMLPGLIDAHTHLLSKSHLKKLVKHGVTGNYSVVASNDVKNIKGFPKTWTSYSMALGGTNNAKTFVENAIINGADYIKVILEDKPRMSFSIIKYEVLRDIVKYAHKYGKKVAVHAVTVQDVEKAVKARADILIHVPLKEVVPNDIVSKIKEQNIAVIPTLIMMKKFSNQWIFGYKKEDYHNAEMSVQRYYENNIPILVGTDANIGIFTPKVRFGKGVHQEMELLIDAGIKPIDVLKGATSEVSKAFNTPNYGYIKENCKADFIIVNGKPDININDLKNISKVYIDGIMEL